MSVAAVSTALGPLISARPRRRADGSLVTFAAAVRAAAAAASPAVDVRDAPRFNAFAKTLLFETACATTPLAWRTFLLAATERRELTVADKAARDEL